MKYIDVITNPNLLKALTNENDLPMTYEQRIDKFKRLKKTKTKDKYQENPL